jgi:hypothetical protein
VREVSLEALGLWVHGSSERLGDPRELARVGRHHAEKPQVFLLLVQAQDRPCDPAKHVLHIAGRLDSGRQSVLELSGHADEHLAEISSLPAN